MVTEGGKNWATKISLQINFLMTQKNYNLKILLENS